MTAIALTATTLAAGTFLAAVAVDALAATATDVALVWRVLVVVAISQGGVFPVASMLYLHLRGVRVRDVFWQPGAHALRRAAVGYVIAIVAAVAGGMVVVGLGAQPAVNHIVVAGGGDPRIFLAMIPVSIAVVGPAEELLFRGVIQTRLREAFGPYAAIAISAAVFAVAHALALSGSAGATAVAVGVLLLPSLVFGWLYEQTGNAAVPALAHGAYDATLFAAVYAMTSS